MRVPDERLVELLLAKWQEDPEGFRAYLPGVSELLPDIPPPRSGTRPRSGLTQRELAYHREGLSALLEKLSEGTLTATQAASGLQHCANLIRDDSLDMGIGHAEMRALVRAAIGKSPGSFKSITRVPISEDGGPVVEQTPVIRGVRLELDREGRLVAIHVHPGRFRDRTSLLDFVGGSSDPQADVAAQHDDYLALQDPHGCA